MYHDFMGLCCYTVPIGSSWQCGANPTTVGQTDFTQGSHLVHSRFVFHSQIADCEAGCKADWQVAERGGRNPDPSAKPWLLAMKDLPTSSLFDVRVILNVPNLSRSMHYIKHVSWSMALYTAVPNVRILTL